MSGLTITFAGLTPSVATERASAEVVNGTYTLPNLLTGVYRVTIQGNAIVPHETSSVPVRNSTPRSFSVVRWGASYAGATYDETFHKFFHQVARIGTLGARLRKWRIPPTELLVVEGLVPSEQFATVLDVAREINQESIRDMFCGIAGPLTVTTAVCEGACAAAGRITIRPNWADGSVATTRWLTTNQGLVEVNVFRPGVNRLGTRDEIKANLAHELFHAAFGAHECVGLIENPFGFSSSNCPFPDSLMANRGDLSLVKLSPQDKLAACIVYAPNTHAGNLFPDTDPVYVESAAQ